MDTFLTLTLPMRKFGITATDSRVHEAIKELEYEYRVSCELEPLFRGLAKLAKNIFPSSSQFWRTFAAECQRCGLSASDIGAPAPTPVEASSELGLDETAYEILAELARHRRPKTASALAGATVHDRRTVGKRLDDLQKCGLVRWVGKNLGYVLTERGRLEAENSPL